MKRKNLIVKRKVKKKTITIKEDNPKKFYKKFKNIVFIILKKKALQLLFPEVPIVYVWLILVKCIHLNLKIKCMY